MNAGLLFIVLFITVARAQTPSAPIPDPEPRPLFPTLANAGATYTSGEMSSHLGIGITRIGADEKYPNKESTWRVPFQVKVDDFTLVNIVDSYQTEWWKNASHIWLEASGFKGFSPLKKVRDKNYVIPGWTMIIKIKDGKILGMVWDDIDGCLSCPGACIDGFCGIEESKCGQNSISCDLQIYVGWIGSDDKGNFMVSAGRRQSQFRNYSLKSAFDMAYQTYNNDVPAEMKVGR